MAETMSLQGYDATLVKLADEKAMPTGQLGEHIDNLNKMFDTAYDAKLVRQLGEVSRLLMHYRFEQALRSGNAIEEFSIGLAAQRSAGEVLVGSATS